jgi:hypothetical protein
MLFLFSFGSFFEIMVYDMTLIKSYPVQFTSEEQNQNLQTKKL